MSTVSKMSTVSNFKQIRESANKNCRKNSESKKIKTKKGQKNNEIEQNIRTAKPNSKKE